MIYYKAEIDIIPGGDGVVSSAVPNSAENNISSSDIISNGPAFYGDKPFILSDDSEINGSKLDYGDTFMEELGYKGYMSSAWADDELILNVIGTDIDHFTIYFDRIRGQYPQTLVINGIQYESDDPIFTVTGITATAPFTVIMSDWKLPKMPYMICQISIGLKLTFDNSSLNKVTRTDREISDNKKPTYGLIAQTGSLELKDINGELGDLAEQNLLKPNKDIKIYLKYKTTGDYNIIGTFKSDIWKYESTQYEAKVSMKDDILRMHSINYDGYLAFPDSLYDVYLDLKRVAEDNDYVFVIDTEFEDYLKEIVFTTAGYLKQSTLWQALDKFSQLATAHIYSDTDGTIKVVRYEL